MKIINNFRIEDNILGTGAYSTVQLATDLTVGRQVAVKVIPKHAQNTRKALIAELRALCKLRGHQNVVKLHHFCCDEDYAYLFIDYLHNYVNLSQYLASVGTVLEFNAWKIFKQLYSAVAYCHANGFVHRDIKLENVMINPDDFNNYNVILIDFGLSVHFATDSTDTSNVESPSTSNDSADANSTDDISSTVPRRERKRKRSIIKEFSGSPLYMPPEVLNRFPHDPFSADIWGLGVVLYSMLYGELPFRAQNLDELVHVVTLEEPLYFATANVSQTAVSFLQRLLDKNPDTRITIDEIQHHPWFTSEPMHPSQACG
jgi:serine/threonine protein kinase